MKHIGKMLILTFEDHEENMIDWIVSCLGIGVKSFQIQNTKTEKLKFRDLRIDFSCRKVIKNNRQECTTPPDRACSIWCCTAPTFSSNVSGFIRGRNLL